MDTEYPVQFAVAYPDRRLNRLTTFFRLFTAIPIVIVFAGVSGGYGGTSGITAGGTTVAISTGGLLFFPPLLMILFRRKYPRWWFDWNKELMRFTSRLVIYLSLMAWFAILFTGRFPRALSTTSSASSAGPTG